MVQEDLSTNDKNTLDQKAENYLLSKKATSEQNTFLFKNSIGKIQDDYIRLGIKQRKIYIKEIAFLQLQNQVDKTINYITSFLGITFLFSTFFIERGDMLYSIFFLISILFMVTSIFYNKENFSVLIVFFNANQKVIKINKNQQTEVKEFIKKLAFYRCQYKI